MKKTLSVLLLFLCSTFIHAQQEQIKELKRIELSLSRIDSLIQLNTEWIEAIEIDVSIKQRYKLYPTENLYTFLQLDTKTGIIKQLQWSLDSEEEGTWTINETSLTNSNTTGNFELYPTKNMYQFILLDKKDGRLWHVQWGLEYSKRWIRRID